jgi:hypothetical protein
MQMQRQNSTPDAFKLLFNSLYALLLLLPGAAWAWLCAAAFRCFLTLFIVPCFFCCCCFCCQVLRGRGFALLRGLPVERWSRQQMLIAYWGIGLHW